MSDIPEIEELDQAIDHLIAKGLIKRVSGGYQLTNDFISWWDNPTKNNVENRGNVRGVLTRLYRG